MRKYCYHNSQHGFSLIELAIVMFIVALLLGGLLPTVAGQIEIQHRKETLKQLDEIQQALFGYAIVNGHLPFAAIPATVSGTAGAGIENAGSVNGVVPWATLGISETDAWGRRFTYSVDPSFAVNFTLNALGTLKVRNSSGGTITANNLPVIILSHGSNGLGGYTSQGNQISGSAADELENANNDLEFIDHDSTPTFDDLIVWISPNILFNRMVTAGKLP